MPSRRTLSGAYHVCLMAFRTTTSLGNRVYTEVSSVWRSSSPGLIVSALLDSHEVWGLRISRNSASLAAHLESENVEFMQFAFRWMNCLLMREISVQNTIRMWDTYLVRIIPPMVSTAELIKWTSLQAEGPDAFSQFHLYVCSAFLVRWSKKLKEMDFQVCATFHPQVQSTSPPVPGHHHVPPVAANAGLVRS